MRYFPGTRSLIYFAVFLLGFALPMLQAMAQKTAATDEFALWTGETPGMHNVEEVEVREERGSEQVPNGWLVGITRPTLTVYHPRAEHRNGTAVVICPGGGYRGLAIDIGGHEVARWFRDRGVVAAVLKYRTAPFASFSLTDAQRALRIMRSRSGEWHLDPSRIGIMGSSAGGHLASTAGTHDDAGDPAAKDPIDRESCHADFMVLVYPVISMQAHVTGKESRKNLLGKSPSPDSIELFSNELHVSAETGATFLVHAGDDKAVPVENSWRFYNALLKHKVPAELHIFERGGHGFGMRTHGLPVDHWPELLESWLQNRGLLK